MQPVFAQANDPPAHCTNNLVDNDGNGLIELCYLEDVDAIREDFEGASLKRENSASTAGCPISGCNGYELARDLDFLDNASYRNASLNKSKWTTGEGWQPIGDSSDAFNATFEGNGYTISNLMINSSDTRYIGLFGYTESEAEIANVGLLDVDITGSSNVGGLVGLNIGTIMNSYATGAVSGNDGVGGLVGRTFGGNITNSYATGAVSGSSSVGGLVGGIFSGATITNSYATGAVSGRSSVGGLVGRTFGGNITNSYAAGAVKGVFAVGGLVGSDDSFFGFGFGFGFISNSYWLREVGSTLDDIGSRGFFPLSYVAGRSAEMLKSPIEPGTTTTDVYYSWDEVHWDFGTSDQFPVLKNADSNALLPDQGVGLRDLEVLTAGAVLRPVFGASTTHYVVDFPADTSSIDLAWRAYNSDATVAIVKRGENSDNLVDGSHRGRVSIRIDEATVLVVTVADTVTTSYTIGFQEAAISDIQVSEPGKTDTDSIVDEGSTVTLNIAGVGNYSYQWTQTEGKPLMLSSTSTVSPSLTIPADYIESDIATSTDIVIRLTLMHNELDLPTIILSKRITIRKKNNDVPMLSLGLAVEGFTLSFDETSVTDADGIGTFGYQWQSLDIGTNKWLDIDAATTAGYRVSENTLRGSLYRVRVTYRDAQGYGHTEYVPELGTSVDVDIDDDGLIEVYYLEHLDAIRYDLDGTSYVAMNGTTGINQGCKGGSCNGYELARDLDFLEDASYISTANKVLWTQAGGGTGWQPIGDSSDAFNATFEGNGYTISNLMINRSDTDHIGLFGYMGREAEIANVGLLDVAITGSSNVGGLVGENRGSITNSYATGAVSGDFFRVGGLVGENDGTITNSYATGAVSGRSTVGGLVGGIFSGATITNSYATGAVSGRSSVGGLVGINWDSNITNSYATGAVSGRDSVGGLVGVIVFSATITNSYWDINTSGITTSAGGTSKTTVELKVETEQNTDLGRPYYEWSTTNWDFGTSSQYPILKNADSNALLPDQGVGLRDLAVLTAGGVLRPVFGASTTHYVVDFLADTSSIDLAWRAYNSDATVAIVKRGENSDNLVDGSHRGRVSIPIDEATVLVVMVAEADAGTTSYTIGFQEVAISDIQVSEPGKTDTDSIVDEGSTITLNIAGVGNYSYQWTQTEGKPLMLSSTSTVSPSLTIPADYIESAIATSTDIVIRLTLMHNELDLPTIILSKRITIRKKNNDVPILSLGLAVEGFTLSFDETSVTDADGIGTFGYQWQSLDIGTNKWVDIDAATTAGYRVSENTLRGSLYRVRVAYIDGQGYGHTEYVPELGTSVDVDIDDDGLIEVYYLEHLDAMRYDLDGTSYVAMNGTTGINQGCKGGSCNGYELARDLDFLDNASYRNASLNKSKWTTGEGWQPIGDSSDAFNATFEGNGYTISNLMINRSDTDHIGLFGYTESEAAIANVGLLDVDIIGDYYAGGLVGWNSGGIITNSYVAGAVEGVNTVGGLVGWNSGSITNSYAIGDITGVHYTGGLVGRNYSGTVANSYATGAVSGSGDEIGGLVGGNGDTITNSYATGAVEGVNAVGGLAGRNSGTITNSYWDINTSGIQTSAGGTSKTTVELKEGRAQEGDRDEPYYGWSTKNWDFGTSSQYPVLKYTDDPNTDDSECRSARDPAKDLAVCGSLLSPILRYGLSELQLVSGNLSPNFNVVVPSYRGTVISRASTIQFIPTAINPNAKIYIMTNEESGGLAIDSGNESGMISLSTDGITTITLKVENGGETTETVVYTLYLNYYEFNGDVDRDDDGLIEIDNLEELNAMRYQLDGTGYRESKTAPRVIAGCPKNGCSGYELARDLDFLDNASYRNASLNKSKWTTGEGWQPIGDSSDAFNATFEGNGYTISNLMINSSDTRYIGLFGYTESEAEIANVGLLDVDITGSSNVGGLVGLNIGTIMNSYATGAVSGNDGVGGLVGRTFGGNITNSYATGAVSGSSSVGGLVGGIFSGATITNSYATGAVSGRSSVGGLVGRTFGGNITNSYAAGAVKGVFAVGGLVGSDDSFFGFGFGFGFISNSYWLREVGSTLDDIGSRGFFPLSYVAGRSAEMLKSPIEPGTTTTDVYYSWDEVHWDFGTSDQFPVLKNADSNALLPDQGVGLRDLEVLTAGAVLRPVFGASTTHYVVDFPADTSSIDLAWRAYNSDATVAIVKRGENSDNLVDGSHRGRVSIRIDEATVLVVTVADTVTTSYTIGFQEAAISDIQVSEPGKTDTDSIVDEGSTVTLNIAGVGNYSYQWTQTEGKPLMLSSTSTVSPSLTIPADYIESDIATSTDIVIRLTLMHNELDLPTIILSKRITIRKKNNDVPMLSLGLAVEGFTLSFDETSVTDADGIGTFGYQWQSLDIGTNKWLDIDAATTAGYRVSENTLRGSLYRVRVTYRDAQGYGHTEYVPELGTSVDVDIDDDGLIEVYYLEHLDAIRYDLDGTSYVAMSGTTGINQGCKGGSCNGYELARDLDFLEDASYISTANKVLWTQAGGGTGWQPIGDSSDAFNATFEGNGYTISNLMINRSDTDHIGLFGYMGREAEIANVGLLDVAITGSSNVGGLVGENRGSITNSYATGAVSGDFFRVGGLVGENDGTITNSYATGAVSGRSTVGGLVGGIFSGATITNSYATGAVSGRSSVGGLVGINWDSNITNSYATGAVSGRDSVGGLVGVIVFSATITNSYWDINTSGITTSAGGTSKTTVELKVETEQNTDLGRPYYEWSTTNWDFGTSSQYPILKNADSNALLPDQGVGLRDLAVLTAGGVLRPVFGASTTHYVVDFLADTSSIDLAWRAYNSDATVAIVKRGENSDNLVDGSHRGRVSIPIDEATVLVVMVAEADAGTTSYTIGFQEVAISDIQVSEPGKTDTDSIVDEGSTITLNIAGVGNYSYQWTQTEGKPLMLSSTSTVSPSLTIPADYIESAIATSTDIVIRLTLMHNELDLPTIILSKRITIRKKNNDVPILSLGLAVEGFTLSFDETSVTDADGVGTFGYQWQSRDINTNKWADIDSATTADYKVLNTDPDDRVYRIRVTYTDAQGYSTTQNVVAIGFRKDVDIDNDGLIEINYLEHLDAMRYDLDGTSYATMSGTTGINRGCRGGSCNGYELARDLDFLDNASYRNASLNKSKWTTGEGWQPIGDSSDAFNATFEGNGYTISNLMINRSDTDHIGLFGYTESEAAIANVGLLDVDIIGDYYAGGLVGWNSGGIITNSYVAGAVEGVNTVGGLVGWNSGSITNSYAIGDITGVHYTGGLVGRNYSGTVANSYATGAVSGSGDEIGGLVGGNGDTITNSYATGAVEGVNAVGGLAGRNSGTITNSYWDINTSGIQTSAGGTSKTTVELKEGRAQEGDRDEPYYGWSTKNWDFGTSSQYPVLKYTDDPNTDDSECRSARDPAKDLAVCGSLLSPILRYGLSELQLVSGNLSPNFNVVVPSYRGTVISRASTIQFIPTAINPNAKIYIMTNEESGGLAIDSGNESGMISLSTDGITTITLKVENGGETTETVVYTLYLNYYEFNGDVDRDDDGLIEIDNLEELNAMRYQLDGTGYRESKTAPRVIAGCPKNGCSGYELAMDLDFLDNASYRNASLNKSKWTTGEGWQPIGDSSDAFNATFEGNGYTISNLMINSSDTRYIGLFGYTESEAEIANVGLLDVDITGSSNVGGLVGSNVSGSITNSYATGAVSGNDGVGGLVGRTFGGNITNSYATGAVSGSSSVGGLVGGIFSGATITNSYATGAVSGRSSVGGLVGRTFGGNITNSYAAGAVKGVFAVGGLVGSDDSFFGFGFGFGFISNSYWLREVGSTLDDIGSRGFFPLSYVAGRSAEMLKSPIEPGTTTTDVYYSWDEVHWDFGTSDQFPVLKNADSNALLPDQGVGLRDLEVLTAGAVLRPVFGASTTHYVVDFPADTSSIDLAWRAYNSDATVAIVKRGENSDNLVDGSHRGRVSIPIDEATVLVVTVADAVTTSYTIGFQEAAISDIRVSEPGKTDTDSIVDEKSTITLNIAGVGNYSYQWTQTEGKPLMLSSTSTVSPSLTIPADYIESDIATSTDIVIRLTLMHNELDLPTIILSKRITIRKKNNDVPMLSLGLAVEGFTLSFDETSVTDADGIGTFGYQWQSLDIGTNKWLDIDAATTAGYRVSENTLRGSLYRVRVTYRDAQGYGHTEYVPELGTSVDVDIDDDGLIEVYYLEHLDAIRYDLDGTSYVAMSGTTGINQGCKGGSCNGYELARDLDFLEDASYISTANKVLWTQAGGGTGWQPIGDSSDAFNATFEGNGYTISNLMINRSDTDHIGLFGYMGREAEIANVGLLDVAITGSSNVGGLVGENRGSITNSYATGAVSGDFFRVGGLVGENDGTITNSYATGAVSGRSTVGGLVGGIFSGATITNSYATGAVSGRSSVGGLVGINWDSNITNSYATGAVSGRDSVGGLVGVIVFSATITNSYWDINTSGITTSAGGTSKTTVELKVETEQNTDLGRPYYEWSTTNWDFGTSSQYPILKNADSNALLPDQGVGLRDLEVLTAGGVLRPVFGASTTHYVVDFLADTRSIDLAWRAYNSDATVTIVKQGENSANLVGGIHRGRVSIPIDEATVLVITVTEADAGTTSYTIDVLLEEMPDIVEISDIVILNNEATTNIVDEGSKINLTAIIIGNAENYRYEWKQTKGKPLMLSSTSTVSPSLTIPADYIESATATSTDIVMQLKLVHDELDSSSITLSKTITIRKENNDVPILSLGLAVEGFTLSFDETSVTDADGVGTFGYQWQSRDINTNKWADIDSATTADYKVLNTDPDDRVYRIRVTYTDAQGYSTTQNVVAIGFRKDVDIDNDGLIEINYLEHLDAMRYDLDGTSYATMSGTTGINRGCRGGSCNGYELNRSLDFNEDAHYLDADANKERWTTGTGWQPIGNFTNVFNTTFIASTETLAISNLMVDRRNEYDVGLFGVSSGRIVGIHLLNVSVKGYAAVGGLVGSNQGQITDSSVVGALEGNSVWIGGLAGSNGENSSIAYSYAQVDVKGRSFSGGLVGYNQGRIGNSYASGSVEGAFYGGGLVGYNDSHMGNNKGGVLRNVYATGNVIGSTYLGGLAGYNDGDIDNGYAIGSVIGNGSLGGLVGINDIEGVIANSYWDIHTSGQMSSAGGTSATTAVLRMSTATRSIYKGWSENDWSFGSTGTPKYPTLKDESGGELPLPEASGLGTSLGRGPLVLSGLQLSDGMLEPPFDPSKKNYELLDLAGEQTTVTATTKANNATISISLGSQTVSTVNMAVTAQLMNLANNIVIRLSSIGHTTATYTIVLPDSRPSLDADPRQPCSKKEIDSNHNGLIEICDIEGLYAIRYSLDGSVYKASSAAAKLSTGCPHSGCIGYELMRNLDFGDPHHYRDSSNQMIWTVDDYTDDNDKGWRPIGDFAAPFNATFKANGYTISGLQINRDDSADGRDYAGFFGHIGEHAEINGVGLSDIDIRGRFIVGGLVGWNDGGMIVNSSAEGNVSGSRKNNLVDSNWIGGLVGSNNGSIINSYARTNVSGHTTVGGLVGSATRDSDIMNSYAVGTVEGINYVGGLIGFNQGRIENCYARSTMNIGFVATNLVGFNDYTRFFGSIGRGAQHNEVNSQLIDVGGRFIVGGLVGFNDDEGTIMDSYAAAESISGAIDGLVSVNQGVTTQSYWQQSDMIRDNGIGEEEDLQQVSVFSEWSSKDWDLTDGEYPTLKYTAGDDENNPACETPPPDTELPNCETLLAKQTPELERIELVGAELFPDFDLAIKNYSASVFGETEDVKVVVHVNITETPLKLNGVVVLGNVSNVVELNETGDTEITVVSVAEATTYTIVVVRQSEIAGFVPGRFAGKPVDRECRSCNPGADGVVQIRFADEQLSEDGDSIRFKVQFRRIFGSDNEDRYIASAGFGLRYNPAAFGENLNDPALNPYLMNMSQCTHERSDFFKGMDNYGISFSDTDVGELHIAEMSVDLNAVSDRFNVLGEAWEDLITMTCAIPNQVNELGLAIAGTTTKQIVLRRYNGNGDAIPSVALLSANNDLRGLRADGGSYVEEYVRHSDGKGVRLKFSKGVAVFATAQSDATTLTAVNFSLDSTTDTTISTVTQVVGSPYVDIEFNRVIVSDVLRLVSTSTYKVYDVDDAMMQGEVLEHGGFAAELAYDSEAPVVESITEVNQTTRNIIFNKPINPATVSKEVLCLTNEVGTCVYGDEAVGSSITSVALMENGKVLQVGIVSVESKTRSATIEFRRGALLGTDYRWVEGYQVGLRDKITIADVVPPTIKVSAVDSVANIQEQTHERITYGMSFTVSADEPIAGLNTTSSYSLLRVPNIGDAVLIRNAVPSAIMISGMNQVTVSYSGIEVSVSDVANSKGFTLRKASDTSLQDLSSNDPVGSSSGFLDPMGVMDENALAKTEALDSAALLASLHLSGGVSLMPPFNPTSTSYIARVANAVSTTTISAIAQNPANINRIRVKSRSLESNIEVNALSVISDAIPLEEGGTTTITIVVIAQNGTTEEYTIAIERIPSSVTSLAELQVVGSNGIIKLVPDFSTAETKYTAELKGSEVVWINTKATHSKATIQIAKTEIMADTPRMVRQARERITLDRGTTTTVIVRVRSQAGTRQDTRIVISHITNTLHIRIFLEGLLQ